MRKIDKNKPISCKAVKSINFDKVVLLKLEERAKQANSTVSNIVNILCKQVILDKNYYKAMAKYYYIQFQEAKYMEDVSNDKK